MSKQDLLMVSLTQFFKKKNHLHKMMRIVHGESNISLRILDWFTTNYSKKLNISYNLIDKHNNLCKFIVYLDYKAQLKAYSKKQFDPFCRRERIIFYDMDNNEIETTVGQLNFFRWAIENNVLDYVEQNLEVIEKDMNDSIRHIYKKSNRKSPDEGRKKRHELSISATKTINRHDIKISVQFD